MALTSTSVLARVALAVFVLALSLFLFWGGLMVGLAGGARTALAFLAFSLAVLVSGTILVFARRPYASTFIGKWAMRVFGSVLCLLAAAYVSLHFWGMLAPLFLPVAR
jgi:hypothetical protein